MPAHRRGQTGGWAARGGEGWAGEGCGRVAADASQRTRRTRRSGRGGRGGRGARDAQQRVAVGTKCVGSGTWMAAPASISRWTSFVFPEAAAITRAVHPCASVTSGSALARSRASAAARWPFSTATIMADEAPGDAVPTLAPPSNSASIISTGPICAAHCSAVQPCESAHSTSARAARRARAASSLVVCAATMRAVPPWRVMRASTSAFASRSASIGPVWPAFAACMSGVHSRTKPPAAALAPSAPSAASSGATNCLPPSAAFSAATRSAAPSSAAGWAPCSRRRAATATWPRESASLSSDGAAVGASAANPAPPFSSAATLVALPLTTASLSARSGTDISREACLSLCGGGRWAVQSLGR